MRSLSRKTSQRASENYKYFVYKNRATGWFRRLKTRWADRKEHKYFRCPQCRATVRVPRGKGKIRITCPRCKNTFIKKS
jgi:protein-arginine kinase activator protein McsA